MLLTATALIAVAASSATRILRSESRVDAAVTFGLFATALVALVVGVAGLLGLLRPVPVLLLAALAAVALAVVARRDGRPRPPLPSTVSALAAARRNPWAAALTCLAVAALAWQVFVALVLPPFGYDALTYRLPTIAGWLQQGDVGEVPLTLCCRHYPLRAAVAVLAVTGVSLASRQVSPAGRALPVSASEVVRLAAAPSDERTLGRLFHHEYRFVDEMPADVTVAVDLGADEVRFVYPLFGGSLERRVVPVGEEPSSEGAWFVTAAGRPVDDALSSASTHELTWDERGVRVWRPVG